MRITTLFPSMQSLLPERKKRGVHPGILDNSTAVGMVSTTLFQDVSQSKVGQEMKEAPGASRCVAKDAFRFFA